MIISTFPSWAIGECHLPNRMGDCQHTMLPNLDYKRINDFLAQPRHIGDDFNAVRAFCYQVLHEVYSQFRLSTRFSCVVVEK